MMLLSIALLKVESMEITKNTLSFSLQTNINREIKCSLLDAYGDLVDSSTIPIFKVDSVTFKSLHPHSTYYLNCQAFSKKAQDTGLSSIIAETKPIEIHTKRSFLGVLFSTVLIGMLLSVVLLIVLAVVRYHMDKANTNAYGF